MKVNTKGKTLIGIFLALFIAITAISATIPASNLMWFTVRLFALWGLYFILVASIMTAFLRELYQSFGVQFIKIHHFFAIAGVIFATLHPLTFAIEVANAKVFIPDVSSWLAFWELAGRPAIYLIYISVLAGIFRKKLKNSWRKIHALMYLVAIFLIVHGNLIGTDFNNLGISIIMNGLFAFSMAAMLYKQYQKYERKKRAAKKSKTQK